MKKSILWIMTVVLGFIVPAVAQSQFPDVDGANWTTADAALTKAFSVKPFFGTPPVLKLSGDYVNTPKEDYETYGVWKQPLSLTRLDGAVATVAFGGAEKRGEWQLTYSQKLLTLDRSWQTIADSNPTLTLSDRRSQVLKASYNLRDRWVLGVAAVMEDRLAADTSTDNIPLGLSGRESLGFQIDTSLRF